MGWSWYLWPSITMRSFVHGWRMQWWDVEDPAIPILWQLPHGFCCIERIEKEARFPRNILMPKGKKRSNKQGNTAVRRTGQKKEGSYATWADGAWRAAGIPWSVGRRILARLTISEFFRWPRALHTATSASPGIFCWLREASQIGIFKCEASDSAAWDHWVSTVEAQHRRKHLTSIAGMPLRAGLGFYTPGAYTNMTLWECQGTCGYGGFMHLGHIGAYL